MPRIVLIDNYDSFTYNLYQYLCELGASVEVHRNDQITTDEVAGRTPDGIVLSPGPCTPLEAGICNDLIEHLGPTIPTLGVCLGMQCIAHTYGGQIVRAPELRHGKTSRVHHRGGGVLRGLPSPFTAVRYHSLVADRGTLPEVLEVTATADENLIMGLRHHRYPVEGIQFHPESILTECGKQLLQNFLDDLGTSTLERAAATRSAGSRSQAHESEAVT